jgi:hypothetical protein
MADQRLTNYLRRRAELLASTDDDVFAEADRLARAAMELLGIDSPLGKPEVLACHRLAIRIHEAGLLPQYCVFEDCDQEPIRLGYCEAHAKSESV